MRLRKAGTRENQSADADCQSSSRRCSCSPPPAQNFQTFFKAPDKSATLSLAKGAKAQKKGSAKISSFILAYLRKAPRISDGRKIR